MIPSKKITTINNNGGLHPLTKDDRDLKLGAIFKQIKIEEVPNYNFRVADPIRIKDQGDTDYCSAYAVTEVSEDQEGIELLPEYQFFKTKQLMGDTEWGADLRVACKIPVKFGSLPLKGYEDKQGLSREEILDPATWPTMCDFVASGYKKETFLSVTGRYDLFDNIRTALWQFKDEKRSVVVGAEWVPQWTDTEGGIIKTEQHFGGFGHAFKFFGQAIIEGTPYLMALLSNGESIGDHGVFYFPRTVVNRDVAPYGAFMFKDIPRDRAQLYQDYGIQVGEPLWSKIIKMIYAFFTR